MGQVQATTELFQWLNEQTDLTSYQIDLVDGFVFMLKKIKHHGHIRLTAPDTIHPRFWKCHDRTFGYRLMKGNRRRPAHLYKFYFDVAKVEGLLHIHKQSVSLSDKGVQFLTYSKEIQLDRLCHHIWI